MRDMERELVRREELKNKEDDLTVMVTRSEEDEYTRVGAPRIQPRVRVKSDVRFIFRKGQWAGV